VEVNRTELIILLEGRADQAQAAADVISASKSAIDRDQYVHWQEGYAEAFREAARLLKEME
jgi:hypothetical protein